MNQLPCLLVGISILSSSIHAARAGESPWDELGVAMSQDEHAESTGLAAFPARVASLRLTPLPLTDAGTPAVIDLNGTWRFRQNPGKRKLPELSTADLGTWESIEVPGDFAMQGMDTARGGYARTVAIPAAWRGSRVKLRFDEVASAAEVWVNGEPVGAHVGHFIPFEFDITQEAEFGADNLLVVLAHKDSLARRMSGYALHVGGGITRGVRVFSVPEVHLAAMHASTDFDEHYENATLQLDLAISNEGADVAEGVDLQVDLRDPSGKRVELPKPDFNPLPLPAGEEIRRTVEIAVPRPLPWNAETPNLYDLTVRLTLGGRRIGETRRRIGFREIEIRGDHLLINGTAVKLRGSNRHLAHPLRGRSLTPELARLDARLFKEANCNFIRTSHYPPSEEFIQACDEIGLYVEEEAPFCFFDPDSQRHLPMDAVTRYAVYANLKMVERDRSHPSVIIWSIGNESRWGPHFAAAAAAVAMADPTRGRTFMWFDKKSEHLTVEAEHYPGPDGVARGHGTMPKLFSEYCHLPAYAPFEMCTDPSVEDRWGEVLETTWNRLYRADGALGGAIWCGVDDRFHKPVDGGREVRGVAPWGILDGWRRPKPAYWHTKKSYSPFRIPVRFLDLPAFGQPLRVPVENRYDFTDLKCLRIDWKLGEGRGVASAEVAAGARGTFEIAAEGVIPGEILELTVTHPDGRVVDEYALPAGQPVDRQDSTDPATNPVAWTLGETAEQFIVRGGGTTCAIDRTTGRITDLSINGTTLMTGGPRIAVVPTFAPAQQKQMKNRPPEPTPVYGSNWTLGGIDMVPGNDVVIKWKGRCDEASVEGAYHFRADGEIAISYSLVPLPAMLKRGDLVWLSRERIQRAFIDFKDAATGIVAHPNRGGDEREVPLEDVQAVPRQIGMIFEVPATLDTLQWERRAQWTTYPVDHIGRAIGRAGVHAGRDTTPTLGCEPDWPWSLDSSAFGTRDFRATKRSIRRAALTNADGVGLGVRSDGSQSSRTHLDGDRIHWLVTARDGGPSESFLDNYFAPRRIRLKLGDPVHDTIHLRPVTKP